MALTDTFTLANNVKIPVLGFGTWQTPDGDVAYQATLDALKAGYRHIDTAAIYGNEESVGRAIADSGIPREDLFITTKLWNTDHGYAETQAALKLSLKKLGLDYVDLYLIHWPNPIDFRNEWQQRNADSWRAMEEAYQNGLTRAIGVSNFQIHHLEELFKTATIKPMVNQLFLNPSDTDDEVVAFNKAHGILNEAYSPLGTGAIFDLPEVKAVANRLNKTVAQVVLRWSLDKGFLPLPKSTHAERIIENGQLFDFELSAKDTATIDNLRGKFGFHKDADQVEF
ncbi:aldo/keto reductase [Periweissella fabalis]|uniref:Aldo/keto reductase n=1 Tax=Periweissella fabalis TaxID=1070421 RepID=A0A7X6S3B5_9LACO|nr:aldo/keto reductase [Periweissella fabalis]MCM0599682.1 aldo/keto reductase [Periweissella fabalis]NKZ24905.1 aldo/keto reductase [Periweissella fabalis]